jgi:hypothetical protein
MIKLAKYSVSGFTVDDVASFNLDANISGHVINFHAAARNLKLRSLKPVQNLAAA